MKHPELARYSTNHLDPALVAGERNCVQEEAEQLYGFQLFTPEFCEKLIADAESTPEDWETELSMDFYEPRFDAGEDQQAVPLSEKSRLSRENEKVPAANDDDDTMKTCFSLRKRPGLYEVYREVIEKFVAPIAHEKWPTFHMSMIRTPYILKYDADDPNTYTSMGVHWDQNPCTMVVYLNKGFEGGGTYFPRWKFSSGHPTPGKALLYPGTLSHEHAGLAIKKGKRYILNCDMF